MVLRLAQGAGRRPWGLSVFLALGVGGFLLVTPMSVDGYDFETSSFTILHSVGGFVTAGFVVAGVLVGRRWPVLGTGLTLLPFVTSVFTGWFAWGWWLGILAVAVLAALDGIRGALVPYGAALFIAVWYCGSDLVALMPIGEVTSGSPANRGVVLVLYVIGVTLVVGSAWMFGVARRTWARGVEVEAVEQRAFEVESLAGERARLARDLHDVVAHHVSLVAVRAESAPFLHPGLNDDAREVLSAIASDAREALTELRQVLVVLQRTDQSTDDRTPQPTACDVDRLVEAAVAAGQPVEVVGTWEDIGPTIGYVLYRAVQEGLTNARRHASGATTRLVRTQSKDHAGFTLTNASSSADDEGRGLIGMRERVEALGGTMSARVVDKAFVLDVSLPVTA